MKGLVAFVLLQQLVSSTSTVTDYHAALAHFKSQFGEDEEGMQTQSKSICARYPTWPFPARKHDTIQTAFYISSLETIDTSSKIISGTFATLTYWEAPLLACSHWQEAEPSSTCASIGGSSPTTCFLHPPLYSPKNWSRAIFAQGGDAAPIGCDTGYDEGLEGVDQAFSVKSFKEQFWTPKPFPLKVVSSKDIPGESFSVMLPNSSQSTCQLTPRVLHYEVRKLVVKQTFNLSQYPFDSQELEIVLQPAPLERYPAFQYVKDINDSCVNFKFSTSLFNEKLHGTKAGDFVIERISSFSRIATKSSMSFSEVILSIRCTRIYDQLVWTYMVSGGIVWICSWLLLFVQAYIPPAVAGTVVAQTVLILITSGQLSSILNHLPPGTESVYLSSAMTGSLICQIFQLVFHLTRQALVVDKRHFTLDSLTRWFRGLFLAQFLWAEEIIILYYFYIDTTPSIVLLILAIVSTIAVMLHFYRSYPFHNDNEESKLKAAAEGAEFEQSILETTTEEGAVNAGGTSNSHGDARQCC